MFTEASFIEFLESNTVEVLCKNHVFEGEPWLFGEYSTHKPECSFSEFREIVADGIQAEPGDVYVTGSSVFGRSTNPQTDRFNKPFRDESDIDVVIISSAMFASTWRQLLKAYYGGYPEILKFHGKFVFRGFVNEPDRDFKSSVLNDLIKRTNDMKRRLQIQAGIKQDIKYRIYRSLEDARKYQAYAFEKCRRKL
ncbi:hypothetical protein [Aquisalinus flavus]|uniref:Uncharacterized protein n=1 Tax=Aquisalinus flavus TaxID=1526572 RepID=A0A8J2V7D5_9PROT|nr:hypothetical protein [Aquisalinus flavus]MBD0425203.1 hypothetical protein [Aquisalinus flavus]UNE49135.1 hypothetical protein FF099_14280 [Aquisalinus flavus]GGD17920.1 hypothetical protein GCM10011342_28430 [Aquisalinus flavus]